ncbi:PREDICTED: putative pentatricopeptide repeat-containing protein At1g43010 [Camelina sativa]|uniref:Pentatricopeptide repeat-containing protein At1g43010 n=1 Tax=Camelina sativa TaxID=90675 RepID=A0ABM0VKH0_CAMSA|nr:PREDICTED: putative pentatricopeptide repeat-containing protein At1g43010 [Camelina sativa]
MTPIFQQHAKRIHAFGYKSSLFRSYTTLWSPEARSQTLQVRIEAALHPSQPLLHQWQQQEKQLYIKHPSESNRFSQELEASKRMVEKKVCTLLAKDYAARLHLIESVLGLEEAEKFFKSIPANMRDHSIYATLLTLYTKSEKTLDKSEPTFKKMRELGLLSNPSPFNSMMSLYSQLGKPNMVGNLLYEMVEDSKVKPENVTANHVLKAYAAVPDVKAMHMFMRMWVGEEGLKLEREMAKAYVRVYSEMYGGNAREMLRTLWDECKKSEEGYDQTVSSFSKLLDDVEGEEDMFGEWKENKHDVRELVTKRSMMLLHLLNLLCILVTLSLPSFVCPPILSIPLVVLSVIMTHISITQLLRFIFF